MLIGIIVGILICAVGYLFKMNRDLMRKLQEKPKPKKLTKEEKDKIKQINDSFEELMGYDYKIALRSDK